ncbi:DUF429 domain-containing protein [Sinorhizobium fredii]|uniref:DUF429 domain-containing protein n=1 Tax=Rhizobium fredii TaxID=380 RepID=UPI0035118390
MRAVLGIDAAWTEKEPSGVALVANDGSGWHLRAVAASYSAFIEFAEPARSFAHRPRGSFPDAAALLGASHSLSGFGVDVVAVDIPLSKEPILARRVSDNAVSTAYGARKCGTHSPNPHRPGPISDAIRLGFESVGYPLQTTGIISSGLIEVYPHPALVELAEVSERLPYKHSKVRNYWPKASPAERRTKLVEVWEYIISLLETKIAGVAALLPMPALGARGYEMKAIEDGLDAVICAWVGICALEGNILPYGDEGSAIWIPRL